MRGAIAAGCDCTVLRTAPRKRGKTTDEDGRRPDKSSPHQLNKLQRVGFPCALRADRAAERLKPVIGELDVYSYKGVNSGNL